MLCSHDYFYLFVFRYRRRFPGRGSGVRRPADGVRGGRVQAAEGAHAAKGVSAHHAEVAILRVVPSGAHTRGILLRTGETHFYFLP